jgi:hypothetical protein
MHVADASRTLTRPHRPVVRRPTTIPRLPRSSSSTCRAHRRVGPEEVHRKAMEEGHRKAMEEGHRKATEGRQWDTECHRCAASPCHTSVAHKRQEEHQPVDRLLVPPALCPPTDTLSPSHAFIKRGFGCMGVFGLCFWS